MSTPFELGSNDVVVGHWKTNPKVSDLNQQGCKISKHL